MSGISKSKRLEKQLVALATKNKKLEATLFKLQLKEKLDAERIILKSMMLAFGPDIRKFKEKQRKENSGQRAKELKYLSDLSKTPEYKAKRNKALQERRKTDPLFSITTRARNLIGQSFTRRNEKKCLTTIKILGCTIPEFKKHIESKFLQGMSFENMGEWHIDHKIPLATAKTKDDIIELCHYTNLQPLWKIDNLKKGHRI